jgi:hypothetical protein
MVNSKRKGSKNERNLAKVVQDWTGFEMVRVPASGGLRWQSGLMITGDIIPADPLELARFPFSIEAKVRKEILFRPLLSAKSHDLNKFWEQALSDAQRVNKVPLLLLRVDGMPRDLYYSIIPYKVFVKLKSILHAEGCIPSFNFSNIWVAFTSDFLFLSPYSDIVKKLKTTKTHEFRSTDTIYYPG